MHEHVWLHECVYQCVFEWVHVLICNSQHLQLKRRPISLISSSQNATFHVALVSDNNFQHDDIWALLSLYNVMVAILVAAFLGSVFIPLKNGIMFFTHHSVCLCVCVCVCLSVCHHVCGEMAGLSNTVLSEVNTIYTNLKMQH